MSSEQEQQKEDPIDLMAPPGPPPRPWTHILIGMGGAIALGIAAVVLVRYFVATRPLDLLPTTQALGEYIGEVLKKNLVPEEAIKRGAPVAREETTCNWYHYTYDVAVPAHMSSRGLRKLLVAAMSERQARVSSEEPLELSIGPYPFAIVNFHGGAPEPATETHGDAHATPHTPTHAPEPPDAEEVELPVQPEELRIASLVLAMKTTEALAAAGAPVASMAVGDPVEEMTPKAVWMRTRVQLGDWTPPSIAAVRGELEAAVTPLGASVGESASGTLTVMLLGETVVEIEFGAGDGAAAPMPEITPENDMNAASDGLAEKVRAGLLAGGVAADTLVALPVEPQAEGEITWRRAHFQVRGGTTIPAAELLAAVLKEVAGAGVEAGVDESAGPPEIHVKLRGKLAVLVELQPKTPMASEDLPPETMVDGPVEEPVPAPQETPEGPRLALILDDGGYDNGSTEEILALDPNLTLAILPYTPLGKEIAERGKALGFEIMLHMPMQPVDTKINFQGQLNVGMNGEDIARLTREALATVPGVEGINNHTGSRFTSDADSMKMFFEGIKGQPFYFIDSATSAKSKAYELAQAAGIPTAKRSVFLDDTNEAAYIKKQFALLRSQAKRTGMAIGIGHFRPVTASVLRDELQKIKDDGIALVHASELTK